MPKRSNDFQKLVHLIYSQMLPAGATVTESALLAPRSGGKRREVDIMIELENPVTMTRIAVECRDRSRKDDVTWIDGIIGKYQDLDVDVVIAVSRLGFSQQAARTASDHRIRTISLRKALDTDWPKQFKRLGLAKISGIQIQAKQFSIEVSDPLKSAPWPKESLVTDCNGTVIGTLKELLQWLWVLKVKDNMLKYVDRRMKAMDLFKSYGDLLTPFIAEARVPVNHLCINLRDTQGVDHALRAVSFRAIGRLSVETTTVDQHLFDEGKALVSQAVLDFGEADHIYSIAAVQIPDKAEITIRWEKKEKRQGSGSGKPDHKP